MRHENEKLKPGSETCAWHAACDRNGDPRCQDDPHLCNGVGCGLIWWVGVTIFAMLVPQGDNVRRTGVGCLPSLACLQRMVLRTVMRFVVVHDE